MTFHDSRVGKLEKVSKSNPAEAKEASRRGWAKGSGPGPESPVAGPELTEEGPTTCW